MVLLDVEPDPLGDDVDHDSWGELALFEQCGELFAVDPTPGLGIEHEEKTDHARSPSRSLPASTTRDQLASWRTSAPRPAGVIRYGRRRSSLGTGSMRPRSTSLVSEPYRVPGPRCTPVWSSTSAVMAYPCLGPPLRESSTSTPGSPKRARPSSPRPCLAIWCIVCRTSGPVKGVGRAASWLTPRSARRREDPTSAQRTVRHGVRRRNL